uniref:Calx-beta domain-containing protein n=1 Tax=Marinobacterium profundum TaxID=1714300 RepID=UPI000A420BF7
MPISSPLDADRFRLPLGSGTLTAALDLDDIPDDRYYLASDFNTLEDRGNGPAFHLGEDWNGEGGGDTDLGDSVFAIANGVVVEVVSDQSSATTGFGNYVVVLHNLADPIVVGGQTVTQVYSLYAHLDTATYFDGAAVNTGDAIAIGEKIGTIGSTGFAEIAQLHFEITLNDTLPTNDDGYNPAGAPVEWVDPSKFIDSANAQLSGLDDDGGTAAVSAAGTPTVSVEGTSNFEGTTSVDPNYLSWTVSLSEVSTEPVTVEYRFLAGTASVGASNSGSDAYGSNSGTSVTFAAGETSKTVSYRIDADGVDELDETVILEVFSAQGAALAGGVPVLRATGWILDDDGTGNNLALFVSRPLVVEGDAGQTQASFEVSLSRPAPEAFTVDYTTVDGSATAGEDYQATSGTLIFAAGQTSSSVTVPVFGDTAIEPTELFSLSFDKPAGVATVSIGSAEILDDDAGGEAQPTVNVSGASNFEGTTSVDPNYLSWTVSLSEPATAAVTVEYRFLAGTASVGASGSGSDAYGSNSGTSVTFAAGETSKTVNYRIDADGVDELDETGSREVVSRQGGAMD